MDEGAKVFDNGAPMAPPSPQPLFVAGDLDGFFGLAVDNLIQFLLVLGLCQGVLGFPAELVLSKVLPGAAISILVGNLFYAWQAQKLSAREGRQNVTALPYGINTVSLFAYVFLVMLPVKLSAEAGGAAPARSATIAWQVGLAACLTSGVIETAGAFVAEKLRQITPRAALLSTLAGIAIAFIAMDFAIRTFAAPLLALLPLAVVLATYFAEVPMSFRIPGGAWAVALGAAAAWILAATGQPSPVGAAALGEATGTVGVHLPLPVLGDLFAGFTHPLFAQITQTLGAAAIATGSPDLVTTTLASPEAFALSGLHLEGISAIAQGFMFTCVIWSAASAEILDRRFHRAGLWLLAGGVLAFFGLVHAGAMGPAGVVPDIGLGSGWRWAIGYGLAASFLFLMGLWARTPPIEANTSPGPPVG